MAYKYFSIVIPAHNEEKYIEKTLKNMLLIDYPKDKFEIIVVENGSTDKTLEKIRKIKSDSIAVYSIKQRGISISKNYGASKSAKKADWLIFLDADSWLDKNSLKVINDYIDKNSFKNPAIGTTRLRAAEKGIMGKLWFFYFEIINYTFGYSLSMQIAKKSVFNKIKYDENLKSYEDVVLIRNMKKFGAFFYILGAKTYTSARRISKWGGLRIIYGAIAMQFLPYHLKTKREYEVVR